MNVSRRWLEGFLRRELDPRDVAARLAMLGAPVDAIEPLYAGLEGILVARVTAVAPHPDADRLRVCTVDDGSGTPKQVVCGAPNVVPGGTYPFAPVGSAVPVGKGGGPLRIERAKLRGVMSEGMLCSARELGLGQDANGLWALDTDAPPGSGLDAALGLSDHRLVVDVTPNRPDLLGHKGVARELAASYGVPYRLPALPGVAEAAVPPAVKAGASGAVGSVRVAIEDAGCARFLGAVILGATVGPSPAWLQRRLEAAGVRPISNVVDATNYVMLELNQPMHAYDVTKLRGTTVVARAARAGEKLVTLDGEERALPLGALVIADLDGPIGLAGVMGGAHSEIGADTRDLFLECAWFDPSRVRKARQVVGLPTDASYRFERGVDRWNAPAAMRRCIELVLATAGGTLVDAPVDLHPEPSHPPRIFLRLARLAQVLGVALPLGEVERCLVAIGCTVVAKPDDGRLAVDVPGWRPDLVAEIDLVEEVARLHGYDSLPGDLRGARPAAQADPPAVAAIARVRRGLAGLGLREALTYPLGEPATDEAVRLLNPLSAADAALRERLLPGLARLVERNWAVRTRDVRLFEVGTVFRAGAPGARPVERTHVAAVVTGGRGPAHWSGEPEPYTLWDAKGLAEAIAELAAPGAELVPADEGWTLRLGGEAIGWAGPLAADAPPWAAPLFGVEVALRADGAAPARFRPLPEYPPVERDIALLLGAGQAAGAVVAALTGAGEPLLEEVRVLSDYRGAGLPEGTRSVAFRLVYRAADRTLRDAEVDAAEARLLAVLEAATGLRRRAADAAG